MLFLTAGQTESMAYRARLVPVKSPAGLVRICSGFCNFEKKEYIVGRVILSGNL
jgi:hypothetical protein